jgi:hypothetical protein
MVDKYKKGNIPEASTRICDGLSLSFQQNILAVSLVRSKTAAPDPLKLQWRAACTCLSVPTARSVTDFPQSTQKCAGIFPQTCPQLLFSNLLFYYYY